MTWLSLSIRIDDNNPEEVIEAIEDLPSVEHVNWLNRPIPCTCGTNDSRLGPDFHNFDESCPRFDDGEVFK